MLPEKKVTFEEFIEGIRALGFMPHLRFRRSQSGELSEHDWIFLVNTHQPNAGSHIGRVCLCCVGNGSINDYQNFEEAFDQEIYDSLVELLFDFTYTDVEFKHISLLIAIKL